MSILSQHPSTHHTSGNTLIIVIISVAIAALLIASYLVAANMKGFWPFMEDTSKTEPTPSVKITKLSIKDDVLTVSVKLRNIEEKGHCVLSLTSKRTALTIDDSKTKNDADFEDCVGWSVGVKTLPAGDYTAKVTFVGSGDKLTATDKITIK